MDAELPEIETTQFETNIRSRIRRLFNAKSVYECLRPLLLFTYWHGLTSFYIASKSEDIQYFKVSIWGYINTAVHIVIYGICYTITLMNDCETVAGYFFRSHITHFGDFLQIISGFIGVTVIYLTAIIPKHYVKKSLIITHTMDEKFQALGIKIIYSTVLRFSCLYILIMIIVNLGYTTFSLQLLKSANEEPSISLHVTFVLQHTVVLFALAMFLCFTKLVEWHLVMMNRVLKNLGHQWDTRSIKTITQKQRSLQCLDSFSMYTIVSKNPAEIIQESMEIHQLICEAASTANKYFTYQLLTIISIAFLIIVFDAYYVLETLLGKSKRESKFKTVEFVTFFSCQMILYLIAIISIVEGSNRAIKKSEKTGGIVHALLNKAKSQDVKEKLQQFSMQLLHLKINFTAAGLFNIDRTLYFTISGALTTYLIILLQFTSSTPTAPQTGCEPNLAAIANHSTT